MNDPNTALAGKQDKTLQLTAEDLNSDLRFSIFGPLNGISGNKQTTPTDLLSLSKLLSLFSSKENKNLSAAILKAKGEKQDKLKSERSYYTPSGVFTKRNNNSITHHNKVASIDIDGLADYSAALKVKAKLSEHPSIIFAMISTRGKGVKALLRLSATYEPKDQYNQLKHILKPYLAKFLEIDHGKIDEAQFKLSQPCYFSFDKDIYVNENAIPLNLDFNYKEPVHIPVKPIAAPTGKRAKDRIDSYLIKVANRVIGKLNPNIARHQQTATCKHISEIIHYAPHLENELKGLFTQGMESLYPKEPSKKKSVAINVTELWAAAVDKNNKTLDKIIAESEETQTNDHKGSIIEVGESSQFWESSGKGRFQLVYKLLSKWLKGAGYHTIKQDGKFTYIKLKGSLIEEVSPEDISIKAYDYIEQEDEVAWEYLVGAKGGIEAKVLNIVLPSIELKLFRDSKHISYFPYKNGVLKVMGKSVELIAYNQFTAGHIWINQVIDRNYIIGEYGHSDYGDFIGKIAGSEDAENSIMSSIGYLLSTYKNPSQGKIVVINDFDINDEPQGRSGKGLLLKGVAELRSTITIDGKRYNPNNVGFSLQRITRDTQVVLFDDLNKGSNFEKFFSMATDGMEIDRKNKVPIRFNYLDSPKIAMTTNYVLKGGSGSNRGRRIEIDLQGYFSVDHSPIDEYGKLFFNEWNTQEWQEFDYVMIGCLQFFLLNGIIEQVNKNSPQKNFIKDAGLIVFEYLEDFSFQLNNFHSTKEIKQGLIDFAGRNISITNNKLTSSLRGYAELKGWKFEKVKKGQVRGFEFLE